jgi:hypothetical protein
MVLTALLALGASAPAANPAQYCAMIEAVLDDEVAFTDEECCAAKPCTGPILVEAWLAQPSAVERRPMLKPGTLCGKYLVVDGTLLARERNAEVSVIAIDFQRKANGRYYYDAEAETRNGEGGGGSAGCGAVALGTISKRGKRWVRK